MKRVAFVVTAALWAYPVFAADDPAIIVCEAVILAKINTDPSYAKHDEKVAGDTAYITYDAVNIYNAPIRSIETCQFVLEDDGKLHLKPGTTDLRERIDKQRELIEARKITGQQAQQNLAALGLEMNLWAMRELTYVLAAKNTGLYPIDPSNTALDVGGGGP